MFEGSKKANSEEDKILDSDYALPDQGSSTQNTPPYSEHPPCFRRPDLGISQILGNGGLWLLAAFGGRKMSLFYLFSEVDLKSFRKRSKSPKFSAPAVWYIIQRIQKRRRRREHFDDLWCYRKGKCTEGARKFCYLRAHTGCRNVPKWSKSDGNEICKLKIWRSLKKKSTPKSLKT